MLNIDFFPRREVGLEDKRKKYFKNTIEEPKCFSLSIYTHIYINITAYRHVHLTLPKTFVPDLNWDS